MFRCCMGSYVATSHKRYYVKLDGELSRLVTYYSPFLARSPQLAVDSAPLPRFPAGLPLVKKGTWQRWRMDARVSLELMRRPGAIRATRSSPQPGGEPCAGSLADQVG